MQDYRKLKVWQKAHRLAVDVIRAAERRKRGVAGDLRSQMARSAASIGANIAEGCGCEGRKEFLRFLQIAFASSGELESHLQLAHETGLLEPTRYRDFDDRLREVRRMLFAFMRSVRSACADPPEPPPPPTTERP